MERIFLNKERMLQQFLLILLSPLRQGLPSNDHKYTDYFTLYHLYWCLLYIYIHSVMTSLYNPMVCSPPRSSVHAIFQARILEWVAMPSSKGSTWLRDGTHISCIASPKLLYHLIHQGKSVCVCVCVCVYYRHEYM